MGNSRILILTLLAAAALLAVGTCRSTQTVVARVITPAPEPPITVTPPAPTAAARRPTATPTPMAVATAAPSIYDRTPGILYEHTIGPTPTATPHRPVGEHRVAPSPVPPAPPPRPSATPLPSPGAVFRPTWTEPPTVTPVITFRIVTRAPTGKPTPTHKPGAYYEPDFQPAVTWTPTPERRR